MSFAFNFLKKLIFGNEKERKENEVENQSNVAIDVLNTMSLSGFSERDANVCATLNKQEDFYRGLSRNQNNPFRRTSLMFYCKQAKVLQISFLLSPRVNAPLEIRDVNRFTALHWAIIGNSKFEGLLHWNSVAFELPNLFSNLFQETERQDMAVRLLINSGANLEARTAYGFTPFYLACLILRVDLINLLISFGANVNVQDLYQFPPLFFALRIGNFEIAQILINAGADLNLLNLRGEFSLIFAINIGSAQAVKFLIDSGADTNLRYIGQTPYQYAMSLYGIVEDSFDRREIRRLLAEEARRNR